MPDRISTPPRPGACRAQRSRRAVTLLVAVPLALAAQLQAALPLARAEQKAPPPSTQASERQPRDIIAVAVADVFKLLRDAELKKDLKRRMQRLRETVDPAFNWEAMAQSSLGPPWRKLDAKQRAEFVSVFKELLAQQYMDDIDKFQGTEDVQIKDTEKGGETEIVKTILTTASREQVPMDYTLRKFASGWAVEDLSVEGVSLVNHYRQTFSRFLANKTFAELMQQLKRKLGAHD